MPLNTRHNFTLIRNGLDTRAVSEALQRRSRDELRCRFGVKPNEVAVLLMGRVCERKRQLDLIHAVAKLPEVAINRCRIFIVGDRPSQYSAALWREWAGLPAGRRERVEIVEETDQPFDYFAVADVAVCSSKFESYPRVTLEAMACGLPIVTVPVWGIREQTRENVNALYYEVGNIHALSAALSRIVTDDTHRSRLAENSQAVLDSLPGYNEMIRSYGCIIHEARLTR
jgi:glycosyltransferase involved in cell wall biosynthesis